MAEYIEREALMDRIELNAREYGEEYDAWQILGDVEDFPAADVAPVVHGKWVKDTTVQVMAPGGQKYHFSCSVCGYITRLHNLNYCPNCGAKMDGGNNADNHD